MLAELMVHNTASYRSQDMWQLKPLIQHSSEFAGSRSRRHLVFRPLAAHGNERRHVYNIRTAHSLYISFQTEVTTITTSTLNQTITGAGILSISYRGYYVLRDSTKVFFVYFVLLKETVNDNWYQSVGFKVHNLPSSVFPDHRYFQCI